MDHRFSIQAEPDNTQRGLICKRSFDDFVENRLGAVKDEGGGVQGCAV
jgi:hypothetical protein